MIFYIDDGFLPGLQHDRVYAALNTGGLSCGLFLEAIREMWVEYLIAFLLLFSLITPTAREPAVRHADPSKCPPLLVTVKTQSFTVLMIVL